nr:hypothetical protein [Tanacetum cinerariifolium]
MRLSVRSRMTEWKGLPLLLLASSGSILKTQSTTMPNVPFHQGTGASGSPRCQEAMRGYIAQT